MSRRRHPIWKTLVVMAGDLLAIGAGLGFAYWLRFHSGWFAVTKGYDPADYVWLFPWACLIWFFSLRFENLYRRRSPILSFNVVRRIGTGSVLALLILFAWVFAFQRGTDFSRAMIPMVYAAVVGALVLERAALHELLGGLARRRRLGLTRALIIGAGPVAARVFAGLARHPEHGIAPIGLVTDPEAPAPPAPPEGLPVLGTIGDLETILQEHRIDEVIVAQPELNRRRIAWILLQCERNLAAFRIVPDTTELLFSGMTVEVLEGVPFLGIRETPLQGWNAALKRMIDFGVAAVALALLWPVFGVVGWLIRRQDGGPVFYWQERMGIDGRRFLVCKFRTMAVEAEAETGPVFAEDDDPRCTPVGRVLRRHRLDELPQLLNVLKGEMSLVGPRPERPYFIEQFRDEMPRYMTRHKVRSGITGWAQINGLSGRHGSIAQRLEYDLYYIENWSLWLDFKILFLTLLHVLDTLRLGSQSA